MTETPTNALVTGPPRSGKTTALESPVPVLAAIKRGSRAGFLGAVNDRADVTTVTVEPETHDDLPERLREWIRERATRRER